MVVRWVPGGGICQQPEFSRPSDTSFRVRLNTLLSEKVTAVKEMEGHFEYQPSSPCHSSHSDVVMRIFCSTIRHDIIDFLRKVVDWQN